MTEFIQFRNLFASDDDGRFQGFLLGRELLCCDFAQSEAIAKYEKVKLKSAARLFQYGMVIGLDGNETSGFRPKLLYCIPNEVIKKPWTGVVSLKSHFDQSCVKRQP